MKTFDILSEYSALREIAEEIEFDEETGEIIDRSESLNELLEEVAGSTSEKLENIEYIKREISASVDALKAEEKRLASRRKGLERNVDRLKELQLMLVNANGGKIKTDLFTFSKRTTKSVFLDAFIDPATLPDEYRKVAYSADKTKLKKAIEQGVIITGVWIEEKEGVSVR